MKILHILCHTIPLNKDYILDGWPARTAKYIKKYSSKYKHECWFAITDINKPEVWESNGIVYKLFPAWTLSKKLESFFGIVISNTLISSLKKEIKTKDTIIQIQGERGLLVWQIINIVKKHPIIIQFHGYTTPALLLLVEKLLVTPVEKYLFKFVSYFFVSIKSRREYLIKSCNISNSKIYNQNLGVDYDMFKPLDKKQAKMKLNIPLDKNIILYIGTFNSTKGVNKIIHAHLQVRNKLNTYLVMIGGSKKDEYYDLASNNADLVKERIPHHLLPLYFSAADVYCMLCPKDKAKTGGFGIAPTEALACNVPIISTNLHEASEDIKDKLGLSISHNDDLGQKIEILINNQNKYQNLRNLSKPYFSWELIAKNIIRLYIDIEEHKHVKTNH